MKREEDRNVLTTGFAFLVLAFMAGLMSYPGLGVIPEQAGQVVYTLFIFLFLSSLALAGGKKRKRKRVYSIGSKKQRGHNV